jgi:alkaline phosphatase D
MAGDQLYSDFPKHLSLFDEDYFRSIAPPGRERLLDCSEEEIRAIFHVRYRHFWSLRGWRKLMANFPCYPIVDDHEIVDNWGSAEEHREAKWQAFRNGAFAAYRDYQAALVCEGGGDPAKPLDYQMALADTATYVMDLRSNRRVGEGPRVVAPEQLASFERFLERHTEQRVLFVVLSVPAIHLPRLLTRTAAALTPDGEDFSDRWSSRGHSGDRDRLLKRIHRHQEQYPDQRIVLLSGDIHIGCLHELSWDDGRPNLYQFISSGITHDTGRFIQTLSSLIMRAKRKVTAPDSPNLYVRLLRGDGPARDNPCGRLNFGIVEFERRSGEAATSMRFYLYTHDGDEPLCQYRSPDVLA